MLPPPLKEVGGDGVTVALKGGNCGFVVRLEGAWVYAGARPHNDPNSTPTPPLNSSRLDTDTRFVNRRPVWAMNGSGSKIDSPFKTAPAPH